MPALEVEGGGPTIRPWPGWGKVRAAVNTQICGTFLAKLEKMWCSWIPGQSFFEKKPPNEVVAEEAVTGCLVF